MWLLGICLPFKAWKQHQPPMDKQSARYKKVAPADDMPKEPELPTLKICQFSGQKLTIPPDIRQHFMQCPLFGPEWRDIITKFDKDWGVTVASPEPQQPNQSPGNSGTTPKNEASPPNPAENIVKQEFKMEPFDFKTVFSQRPKTLTALRSKFGAELTEMVGPTSSTSFFLAPGPELYIMAKDATHIKPDDAPVVMHGAGSWLTGDKAVKFEANNPQRAIPCCITSDQVGVVFEDWVVSYHQESKMKFGTVNSSWSANKNEVYNQKSHLCYPIEVCKWYSIPPCRTVELMVHSLRFGLCCNQSNHRESWITLLEVTPASGHHRSSKAKPPTTSKSRRSRTTRCCGVHRGFRQRTWRAPTLPAISHMPSWRIPLYFWPLGSKIPGLNRVHPKTKIKWDSLIWTIKFLYISLCFSVQE